MREIGTMVELTTGPIDVTPLVARRSSPQRAPCWCSWGFRGSTPASARRSSWRTKLRRNGPAELERLESQARERWELVECAIVHRLGVVPISEASVAVVVSSPHRARCVRGGPVADRCAQGNGADLEAGAMVVGRDGVGASDNEHLAAELARARRERRG